MNIPRATIQTPYLTTEQMIEVEARPLIQRSPPLRP